MRPVPFCRQPNLRTSFDTELIISNPTIHYAEAQNSTYPMMPEVQADGEVTGAEKAATGHDDSSADTDETQTPSKPIPPPDIGLQAYLQILGGFFLMFNTWGIVLTFGTFQSFVNLPPPHPNINLQLTYRSTKHPQQPPSKPPPPPPPG